MKTRSQGVTPPSRRTDALKEALKYWRQFIRSPIKHPFQGVALHRTTATPSIATEVEHGYSSVFLVLGTQWLSVLQNRERTARSTLISLSVAAGWPLALNAIIWLTIPNYAASWLPSIGFTLLSALGFGTSSWAWHILARASPALDTMLHDRHDLHQISAWIRRRMSIGRQFLSVASGVLVGAFVVSQADRGDTGPLAYLIVCWATGAGGEIAYGAICVSGIATRLKRCSNLTLRWNDPAHTPGIATICRGYAFIAASIGAGAVVTEVLAIFNPASQYSITLQAVIVATPIALTGLAVYATCVPYYAIHSMIKSYKDKTLEAILNKLGELPEMLNDPKSKTIWLDLYSRIAAQQCLPIRTSAIVQYVAAILGSLVAYLLGFLAQ